LTSTLASYTPLQSPSHRPQVHSIKLPIQNSKEIQDIPAKESEVIFSKKRRKKKRSPLSILSCKLWSSNKFKWEAIHAIHSIPSKKPHVP
jgi:hypothetical protein